MPLTKEDLNAIGEIIDVKLEKQGTELKEYVDKRFELQDQKIERRFELQDSVIGRSFEQVQESLERIEDRLETVENAIDGLKKQVETNDDLGGDFGGMAAANTWVPSRIADPNSNGSLRINVTSR